MVKLSHSQTTDSLNIFYTKSPFSTMKHKSLVHNLIISHICRIIRALSKAAKSILDIFSKNQLIFFKESHLMSKNKYRNKVLFGSFRLHYNWCSSSSHVLPMPSPVVEGIINSKETDHLYYDSTWNSALSTENDYWCNSNGFSKEEAELSSYLQWLEEKGDVSGEDDVGNEIDALADMFIASCHEKFRLEKIESYRRYQEMLARGM